MLYEYVPKALQVLGALTAVSAVSRLLSLFRLYFSPGTSSLSRWKHGEEPYALVTGGTDGIGLGFVEAIAAQGFNVIILSRNKRKLESRRSALQKQFPKLKFEILVFDALKDPYESIEKLVAGISHLNITVLVNNVGGIPFIPGYRLLTDTGSPQIDAVIDINTRFLSHFTRFMIPVMAKNDPALIANVGSAAQVGIPWAAVYSGTKGFVLSFSEGLSREFKCNSIPIDVLNITLADVSTQQTPTPVHILNPSAQDFSRTAVSRLGAAVASGRNTVTPYILHALLLWVFGVQPESVKVMITNNMIRGARELLEKAHGGLKRD
ncbi:hypothetical protein PV08_06789 [Exophiala spinifera]|uniref:3-ketoacyl-CoA reductase n=1 Tax=Exophiala spinifera TaxID=91928 RepID=A0A0D2B569_9EURO|nr:uncharacterized protein PV08_06789 [Exophiala spinifera]KIW14008.1 hypothetical protein PV08_06789 [Exophiala spinifera]